MEGGNFGASLGNAAVELLGKFNSVGIEDYYCYLCTYIYIFIYLAGMPNLSIATSSPGFGFRENLQETRKYVDVKTC